jgi:hypothetical protein
MAEDIPLTLQTAYADLVERAAAAAFNEEFAESGSFISKTVRGKRYWYFQLGTDAGRKQRYVGAETPDLLERIRRHREVRDDYKDRQIIVSTLVRSVYLPRPLPKIGEIVAALSRAGVFRLGGVLVGTVAYQTYSAMLGVLLPKRSVQTIDVDIAQFKNVAIVAEERLPPILGVLKQVDRTFRDVPSLHGPRATSYQGSGGIRVDFLTPKTGPDTDGPERLPALGTDAQPLRFLDFLIRDPQPAVLLHGAGVYVQVPAPERYAVHKLIIAQRRPVGAAKRDKDLVQARALLAVLSRNHAQSLQIVWREALGRGKKWRTLIGQSLGSIDASVRDQVLKAVGATRDIIPGLDLRFGDTAARYLSDADAVEFLGEAANAPVRCAISREALEDHFSANGLDPKERLQKYRENRDEIHRLARAKYLKSPVEVEARVTITSADVSKLVAA